MSAPGTIEAPAGPVLITGGAGFIGSNLAARLAGSGVDVVVFDNLSRPEVARNLRALLDRFGPRVRFERGDVRDAAAVRRAVEGAAAVFHLAAQVAVTTSLADPSADFEVNARGTLHVLEALRALRDRPPLVFTSTNKVYGALADLRLRAAGPRYVPEDPTARAHGVSESRPLDFHSPYGCSKGAADQYASDYARSYGVDAVVLRMSCIYGPRQFGSADQGWVAHFARAALAGRPITIYGDGRQVRDLLFVEDLVDALLVASRRARELRGLAFNVGGGPARALSLLDLIERLARITDRPRDLRFEGWRTGDQRWYVSDTRRFTEITGWRPRVALDDTPGDGLIEAHAGGLRRLVEWIAAEARGDGDDLAAQAFETEARG